MTGKGKSLKKKRREKEKKEKKKAKAKAEKSQERRMFTYFTSTNISNHHEIILRSCKLL